MKGLYEQALSLLDEVDLLALKQKLEQQGISYEQYVQNLIEQDKQPPNRPPTGEQH